MFERLITELCNKPTEEICVFYQTVGKIRESYARTRQLYPADTEIQHLYEDMTKIEKLLQDVITERFLSYKDDEVKK